jgi:hypothetical protein
LWLDYKNIHACNKGYVLFSGPYKVAIRCPKCGAPCYKDEGNKIFPMKVLWHFPIVLRLQIMFRTPTLSKLMLWHSQNNSLDGLVKHPCDSKAWKHVHAKIPTFGSNPINVHLALFANGVNPYKLTHSNWSTWSISLLNYNISPWLTTKKFF